MNGVLLLVAIVLAAGGCSIVASRSDRRNGYVSGYLLILIAMLFAYLSGAAAERAQAAEAPCVTEAEYQSVHVGDSRATVAEKFGTSGRRSSKHVIDGRVYSWRAYRPCGERERILFLDFTGPVGDLHVRDKMPGYYA